MKWAENDAFVDENATVVYERLPEWAFVPNFIMANFTFGKIMG